MAGQRSPLPLLEARGLEFSYPGGFRLGPLDLRLQAGEVVALEGEPGAGKSTLLRLLQGRLRPSAGHLLFRQEPLRLSSAQDGAQWRRCLGVLDQGIPLPALRSPRELVRLSLAVHGQGARERRREATRILGEAGLLARAEQPCGTLSTGQSRWVHLALAMCGVPELMLLDEPLAHLSPDQQAAMVRVLERQALRGTAVLFCRHGDAAAHGALRRLRLEQGRLIEEKGVGGRP
jgi:ABC-type multidrug transport system ATPase subunit